MSVTGGSRFGINVLVDNFVGDALLGIDWTGRPQPRLADSWTWSPDHLTLELRLHSGVLFHDGTIADAASVASLLRSKVDSLDIRELRRRVAGRSRVDPDVVVVHLKRPERLPAGRSCGVDDS